MSDNNTKTFYHDCGKGDRPRGTGWANYYSNFDSIFGKKEEAVEEAEENLVVAPSSDGQEATVG